MKNHNPHKPFFLETYGGTTWKAGDTLSTGSGESLLILKVYKPTWFRKLLKKMGFHPRMSGVKVKLFVVK